MALIGSGSKFASLEAAALAAAACVDCGLCMTRTQVVFGRGNPQAKLMIIGEGPGQHEDESGLPFVGQTGALLDKILQAGNIDREKDVYICNVVKCRPPGNRAPESKEREACLQYLQAQLFYVRPKLILLAGSAAVQTILQVKDPISHIRGKWFPGENDARVMPVFHPSYLLRNDSKEVGSPKWLMWQDIKEVRKQLDILNR
ncbi:MAG: uracil-DNA glycosylase [Cyanobacteria bacterium REEB67]|nr:uracil-DNA glycosylase [Cyanobacteria bacterium REEB67]